MPGMVTVTVNKGHENWHTGGVNWGVGPYSWPPVRLHFQPPLQCKGGHVTEFWLMDVPHLQAWPIKSAPHEMISLCPHHWLDGEDFAL